MSGLSFSFSWISRALLRPPTHLKSQPLSFPLPYTDIIIDTRRNRKRVPCLFQKAQWSSSAAAAADPSWSSIIGFKTCRFEQARLIPCASLLPCKVLGTTYIPGTLPHPDHLLFPSRTCAYHKLMYVWNTYIHTYGVDLPIWQNPSPWTFDNY